MTSRAWIHSATARLEAGGADSPRRTAEWMLEDLAGIPRVELYARPHRSLSPEVLDALDAAVARRVAGEPLQYILGHADFYGLRLRVTPAVLIPRPETEELVEVALAELATRRAPWVLDVGTGSGAIALAIQARRPEAEVFAADVSPAALAVAQDNAARLQLDVTFVEADALRPRFADHVPPAFDLLVSNPPYVPDAERPTLQRELAHEPALALFVPDADPLVFYRALGGHAGRLLRPGGCLAVETHADHAEAVRTLFESGGLSEAVVRDDLSGRPRMVVARQPA